MYNQKELSKYKIANMVFDFKDVEYDYKLKKESEQVLRYQPDIVLFEILMQSPDGINLFSLRNIEQEYKFFKTIRFL